MQQERPGVPAYVEVGALDMSALGHKRTFREVRSTSAIPPKADTRQSDWHICLLPLADINAMLAPEIPPSLSLTRFTILPSRPLTAVVKDNNPRSDEFCASTDDPAALDFFDNDREGKSIV
jgi:hypothetical protein